MATSEAIDRALRAEQLRQHATAVRVSLVASLVIASVLTLLLWDGPHREQLPRWLAALAVLAATRGAVWLWQRLSATGGDPAPWLLRYRLSYACHGLGWGAAAVLLLPAGGHADADVLVFALTALAGGAWFTTVFDPLAALAFSVPVLAPLLLELFGPTPAGAPRTGVMVVMFLAVTVVSGLRAHRGMRETVRLRVAEDDRAGEQRRSAEQAQASARALAEKHRLIDLLVETTHQGFWFIDTAGKTTEANPAMCALLGRRREEVIGHNVFEFFSQASLDTLQAQLAARRLGQTGGYDVEIVRPDGSRRHCFNSATPLYDDDGRQVGSIGIWTDLTERRQAELVLRTYEAVTQSITDLVSVIGEDRVYRLVNDAWCRAMNLQREQVIGRNAAEAMPQAATPQRQRALHECLASGQPRTVRGLSEIPSLAGRQLETTFYPYGADAAGVRCVVMVTRDVTEQEEARVALAESAEYLLRTLNATGDAIFASDAGEPNEPVRFVNDQMLQMFDIPGDKASRLTPADIMAYAMPLFEDPAAESRRVQAIIAAEATDQSHLRLRDGRVLVRRCIPARIGTHTVRVWSFRDVTAEERALEAVRSRDAEQRALLDAFPGFIARLDPDNRYTHVNERMAALIGATPQEILGSTVGEMLGARYTEPMRDQFQRALAGETVTYDRHQPATPGRAATDIQITLARGVDPTTDAAAVYAFGIDISSLKQAEQALRASESELRALLGAFPGHIAVLDRNLDYSFVNERFAEVIGLPPARIVGQPAREVLGDVLFDQKADEARRAGAGERIVTERSFPARAGRPRLDLEVTLVAGPRQGDGRQATYSFGVDITARKRAEEAMAAARDEAERANRAKSQFLSQMSHELRTPLNAIIGFGQLIGSDPGHELGERQQGYMREIVRGGRHLLDLINDVLDLGRIEAGKLVVDPASVALRELANDCLALIQPLADAHGVRIEAADGHALGVAVSADRMRLKQVLINLLSNAIKYNRPGGHVTLLCERDGATVRLGVRDTGHGLSASELARLFQPFERLGAAQTGIEGTGIGLVLSRRLAEAMGGTIEVDSEVGQGSTFWIRLPLAQPRASAAVAAAATRPGTLEPPAGAAGHTVLYIEDNPVNVMLMEAMLARLPGLRMLSAALPQEGLQLARTERPALVLLDIQLPGMDGYEVMRRLQARDETREIPVIAVTANAMSSEADAALAAGFAAYLTKPLDLDTLLDTVQHALQATA